MHRNVVKKFKWTVETSEHSRMTSAEANREKSYLNRLDTDLVMDSSFLVRSSSGSE